MRAFAAAVLLLIAPSMALAANSATSKTTSIYWEAVNFPIPVPNTDTLIATVPLPEKYSSKKNVLLITTTVDEACSGDNIYSTLLVGGVPAAPDTGNVECYQNEGFESVTRTWEIPSEAQGGTPIPEGSTVELHFHSLNGTANRSQVNIHVVAAK